MKMKKRLMFIATIVVMTLVATACSDGGSDEENSPTPPTPPNPETPVNNDEWQVVPAGGGEVKKGDFTMTIPSGTFAEGTKIALTEVDKGEIGGEDEVSKFYQVVFPSTTKKGLTVSIKCKEQADDIYFVVRTEGRQSTTGNVTCNLISIQSTYKDGEYKAELPAVDNGTGSETTRVAFGLAHVQRLDDDESVTTRSGGGKVRWHFELNYAPPAEKKLFDVITVPSFKDFGLLWLKGEKFELLKKRKVEVNGYIKEAVKQIQDFGFEVTGDRNIPIILTASMGSVYGTFTQNGWKDSWSTIQLNLDKIMDGSDTTAIKQTIIHEMFHYFQAEYDPRWVPRLKLSTYNEGTMLLEMGAVWIEQFMNKGKLNATFILESLPLAIRGLKDVLEFQSLDLVDGAAPGKYTMYQRQGYGMAPLLQYFTKIVPGIDDKAVLELYQLWSKKNLYTFDCLREWERSKGSNVLSDGKIDDYYLKLCLGEIDNGIHIAGLYGRCDYVFSACGKQEIDCETIYPYGCSIRRVDLKEFKDTSMDDKCFVFKPVTPGIRTYLITTDMDSKNAVFKLHGESAATGDSIVIEGKELESFRQQTGQSKGSFNNRFYIVCTLTSNAKKMPTKVSVELRNKPISATISPDKLSFLTPGGTKSVTVSGSGFKHVGYDTPPSWLTIKVNADNTISFTALPNFTGQERTATVKCYVTNADEPTDNDKKYLPVTVTQSGAVPTVSPSPMTFEAEGGMQALKIEVQGWKYCGCIIDEAAKSWLSRNYTSGGVYEVTAQPNTTSKERTTTIRCYVADEKNAPDDKRIYMEVPVTQKAGKEQTSFDKYQLAYGYVEMNIYTAIDGNNTMGRIDFDAKDKFLTVTSNGKGLHFDINYKVNEKDYNETLSCQFDIDDLSLMESKKSKITNLSWKVDTDNQGGRSMAGVWGWDGFVTSQTQKIRFSTSSKIPQPDFDWDDGGTRSVNWYAESNNISPSECSYVRTSITLNVDEDGPIIDKGNGMQDGSMIWINLHFNVVDD